MTDITELVKRLRRLAPLIAGDMVDEAADALEAQAERIAEQDSVLEMKWAAEDRAIKAWQEKTGERMTWPDQAKLVEWLMGELDAARAKLNGEK